MDGLSFVTVPPAIGSDPARADIACFAGFVARRPVVARGEKQSDDEYLEQLPSSLRAWWRQNAWKPGRDGRTAEDLVNLWNVPVPIANWEAFDQLFAWEEREVQRPLPTRCDTLLGAAVRSFFAQGGRNCYVVRLGDPWPVLPPPKNPAGNPRGLRDEISFLPRFPEPSPVDRASWKGVGHVLGLPDVSFLCLPDLVELFATEPAIVEPEAVEFPREEFKECAEELQPPPERNLAGIRVPRLDENGFRDWEALVRRIGDFLKRNASEVQFIAAIPLPIDASSVAGRPGGAKLAHAAATAQWDRAKEIDTVFVQLVYPWLRAPRTKKLPGWVEPPDGVLAGLLANNALSEGSWRNVIHQPVPGISALEPVLDAAALAREFSPLNSKRRRTLRERVTIIGPSPTGFRMLSDVTMDEDETYRPANVNRLTSAIVRAARVVGETAVFQNNGQELWTRLRERMENLLAGLWAEGALEGNSAEDAFEVRCDRSTITQNDLDAGRVICRVSFTAAMPIVQITIVLAMEEGGNVSITSRDALAEPQFQAA